MFKDEQNDPYEDQRTRAKAKQDTQPFASGAHAVVWAVFERSARVDMAELTAGKRGDAIRARDRLTETARRAASTGRDAG